MMTKGVAALPEELPVSEAIAYAQYACFRDLEKIILEVHKKIDYRGDEILAFLSSRNHKWSFSTINISKKYKNKLKKR